MYRVYSDSYLLHDDLLESLKIRNAKVELELNRTGSFEFTIEQNHPYYAMVQKLKSIITVYQDDFLLFRGRILNDELGFYNEKNIVCEGQLAFLLDSIQRPYNYTGTVSGFLNQVITLHTNQVENSHNFHIGNVSSDLDGPFTAAETEYTSTWEAINKKLIEVFGGYINVRESNGLYYIDYLSDFSTLSSQKVEFAKNLLDMKRIRKGEDIASALIPLGKKIEGTDERLTIASVNNNLDYIYSYAAVNTYGWICKVEIFDDVTDAAELLTKGQAFLSEITSSTDSIELSAADLNSIDTSVESFHLGEYVNVISTPHGINQNFLVNKLSINLLAPESNSLVLGGAVKGLTEDIKHDQEIIINNVKGYVDETIVQETTSIASSLIEQSAGEILQQVSADYFLKTDGEELGTQVGTINTTFTQNADAFNYLFTSAEDDMNEVHQYIRFEEGNIILGESENELTLKIENDRITFFDGSIEVAYFSNQKLYVTDGDFTNVLRIGSFAFSPRLNGNLSFTKL